MNKNFIVLSHPRSGTTYLTNFILTSHYKVHCYDELFFLSETTKNWLNDIQFKTRFDSPYNYYKKIFSSQYSVYRYIKAYTKKVQKYTGKKIIGFKLFPTQLRPYEIEYLLVKKKIPTIVLRRKNMIQAAISYQIAKITGQWAYEYKKDFGKIEINIANIEEYLKTYTDSLNYYEQLMNQKGVNFHKCYYESLFTLDTINKIFDFLKLEHINEIPEGDKKLNTPDRYRKIRNLQEIENRFCNDENGYLFDK